MIFGNNFSLNRTNHEKVLRETIVKWRDINDKSATYKMEIVAE